MGVKSWSPLDYDKVLSVYKEMSFTNIEITFLFQFLCVLFCFFNIFKLLKKQAFEEKKEIDVHSFLQLIKEYLSFIILITFLPFLLDISEIVLGEIAKAYKKGFGEVSNKTIFQAQKDEVTGMVERTIKQVSNGNVLSIFSGFSALDTILVLIIKPFIVLIDNWSYSVAIIGRFVYLAALKLTGGFALACYIYEPTRQYFYVWFKNLIVCYMLIPGFFFVAQFVDMIRNSYIGEDNIQIAILIICLMGKILGFGLMSKYLSQSI